MAPSGCPCQAHSKQVKAQPECGFYEHLGCVSAVGDPQALPKGPWGSDGDRRRWEPARLEQGCAQTGRGRGMQAQPERPAGARDAATVGNTLLLCGKYPVTVGWRVVGKRSSAILCQSGSERKSFSLTGRRGLCHQAAAAVPLALDGQQHVNSQTTGCVTHRWSCSQSHSFLPDTSGRWQGKKIKKSIFVERSFPAAFMLESEPGFM